MRRILFTGLVPVALFVLLAGCSTDDAADEVVHDAAATDDSTPATADRSADPSLACGTPDAEASSGGDADLTFTSGGVERRYEQVVPSAHDGETPVPLVLDLHGLMSPYGLERAFTEMDETAEDEGFVVLYPMGAPDGQTPAWTVGAPRSDASVAYLDELITATGEDLCIDLARVYATGFSNGGMMSSRLACDLSDRIAAVATVAGTIDFDGCDPERPVPWMAFHGTADDILPMEGGAGPGLDAAGIDVAGADAATGTAGQLKPIRQSIAGIAERYGCEPEPPVERVSDHVTEEAYAGCDEGADVVFFTIEGGGHAWPGGLANPALEGLLGQATQEISANGLMWEFFEQHPLPAG